VVLRSVLEPEDVHAYVRRPGSLDRLFHYEARLGLIMLAWDRQAAARYPEVWQKLIAERVHRQWKSIQAYLRWRSQMFQQAHLELPAPKQVILHIRLYPTPGPGEDREVRAEPVEQPLARWQPGTAPRPGYLPVEAWDPVTGRFAPLKD
jgi:hypothetical protein